MSNLSSESPIRETPRAFPPTRWSVVLAARQQPSPASAEALEAVCRAYWYPLYAYVRRSGSSSHDAQDIAQTLSDPAMVAEERRALFAAFTADSLSPAVRSRPRMR